MKKFFEDVLKLSYKGNSQDNPEHEDRERCEQNVLNTAW